MEKKRRISRKREREIEANTMIYCKMQSGCEEGDLWYTTTNLFQLSSVGFASVFDGKSFIITPLVVDCWKVESRFDAVACLVLLQSFKHTTHKC